MVVEDIGNSNRDIPVVGDVVGMVVEVADDIGELTVVGDVVGVVEVFDSSYQHGIEVVGELGNNIVAGHIELVLGDSVVEQYDWKLLEVEVFGKDYWYRFGKMV